MPGQRPTGTTRDEVGVEDKQQSKVDSTRRHMRQGMLAAAAVLRHLMPHSFYRYLQEAKAFGLCLFFCSTSEESTAESHNIVSFYCTPPLSHSKHLS